MVLKILIIGPPAGGKGTQSRKIVAKYGVIHLSTGQILRKAVKDGTELGKKAEKYMKQELVYGIVKDRLLEEDCQKKGFLLDGFPRTGEQAKFLIDEKLEPNVIVLLQVPDDVVIDRIEGRRSDPVTGEIYHMKFYPPPDDEEVLKRLKHRCDDTKEKILIRLDTYHKNFKSIMKHFDEKMVQKINGDQGKDKVFVEVDKALSGILEKK